MQSTALLVVVVVVKEEERDDERVELVELDNGRVEEEATEEEATEKEEEEEEEADVGWVEAVVEGEATGMVVVTTGKSKEKVMLSPERPC